MRNPFDIYPETNPADTLDALYSIAGDGGAPKSVNGLGFSSDDAMFGQAVTLRSVPSRPDNNAAVNERAMAEYGMAPYPYAMSLCDERSVLVIETRGMQHFAAGGGTGLASLFGRKAAGLITDGELRDSESVLKNAKASGTKLAVGGWTLQYGTGKALIPSDVNVPVSIHNTLVVPGDFVFGNSDGIVFVPATIAEEVLETAVLLGRKSEVMEDMLIEKRGIVQVDVTGDEPEIMQEVERKYGISDRQRELFEKHITGVL